MIKDLFTAQSLVHVLSSWVVIHRERGKYSDHLNLVFGWGEWFQNGKITELRISCSYSVQKNSVNAQGHWQKSTEGIILETENHVPFRKVNKKCRARTVEERAREKGRDREMKSGISKADATNTNL